MPFSFIELLVHADGVTGSDGACHEPHLLLTAPVPIILIDCVQVLRAKCQCLPPIHAKGLAKHEPPSHTTASKPLHNDPYARCNAHLSRCHTTVYLQATISFPSNPNHQESVYLPGSKQTPHNDRT
jgi:hypothetical protein